MEDDDFNFLIGFPTSIVFFEIGSLIENPKKTIFENLFNILLEVPIIAFCSCKKRGFLQIHADKPTGNEMYPPKQMIKSMLFFFM